VVATVGEPTLNADLEDFLIRFKELDLCTGLETNGTNPDIVAVLLERDLLDYLAMDVKAPLEWEAYSRAAGLVRGKEALFENVKRTLEHLRSAGVEVELRCTVVPGIHTPEDIRRLAGQLQGFPRFVLQQFSPGDTLDTRLRDCGPFDIEVLEDLHREIQPLFPRSEFRWT
jgi:pyruvate formate lyase activating enzyme